MKPGKSNPVCIDCGLCKSCSSSFMEPDGSKNPKLLIIGEAPGEEEDAQGRPFVGRSGVLLRSAIEGVGFNKNDVLYTNVVRCRPKDNKISKVAIQHCKQFAIEEIESYKPEITLLMGNSPLEGILGEYGITNWNGVSIERGDKKYMPLYHPAYILRNQSAMDEWLNAMLSIEEKISGKEDVPRYGVAIPQTLIQLGAMCEDLSQYEFISFDTEVSYLNPYSANCKLLAVSFAVPGTAYAVPVDHKDSWFIGNRVVKEMIAGVLAEHDEGIIGHNLKFDQMHAKKHLGVEFSGHGDTMLISSLLDSRQGSHGLKKLAGIYCNMYEYDSELQNYVDSHADSSYKKGGNYGNIPLEILLPYAAADAEATVKLYQVLYPKLTDVQKTLHTDMIMKFSDMLCDIQTNGMQLDSNMANWYSGIYNLLHDEKYDDILKKRSVKLLLEMHKDKSGFKFNPNSTVQLSELYYDICNMPILARTKTGKNTTSAKIMKKLETRFPLLYDIRQYKLLGKMLSTYLLPATEGRWVSGDGRVRSTYNISGARTGRISSHNPNLQNIPTPEKEPGTLLEYKPIKNVFTHSYVDKTKKNYVDRYCKGVLLSADYSGMELRVFASLARCKAMIDIHKSGKDFHSCVAIKAMTHKPIKDITFEEIRALPKDVRYRYKWTNWTLLYGGGSSTLISMYEMKEQEAKDMVDDYYREFPEVLRLRRESVDYTIQHGYIESPFGRREYLPDIASSDDKRRARASREAINMPTQSASSDLTLCASYVIYDMLRNGNYRSKIVNTVHDSVLLDVPREEIHDVAKICVDAMENLKKHKKKYFPTMNFDWLICPLRADIEIGTHYGTELSIDDWEALYG